MKIVLASGWPGTEAEEILKNMHITEPLMSFYYPKKDLNLFKKYNKKIYLDSGVFTARKKGKSIDINALISYLKKHEENISCVFNLDIGSPAEQLKNYLIMKKKGCNVLPIWHGTMSLDMLLRFAEDSDYIAISESFIENGWKNSKVLDSFFNFLYKNNLWPMKVHALGIERPAILSKYPFYSADSSAFQKSYTFGLITNFDYKSIKAFHPKENVPKALKINSLAQKMIGRTYEARDLRIANAVLQRERLQKYLTDLWTKKGIVWNET